MEQKKYMQAHEEGNDGSFKRQQSQFRNKVTADGSSGFKAEKGRYHLYISLACPWACRCLTFRKLKGLEDAISLSIVKPVWGITDEKQNLKGWVFCKDKDEDGATVDHIHHTNSIRDIYLKFHPNYTGRFTVPVLFDTKTNQIVNNESSEIIRMFNSEFNEFAQNPKLDLYPEKFRKEIDQHNDYMYDRVNNGVYRCGFATTQEAYEKAFYELFEALDFFEDLLKNNRYLCGDTFTESDIRLFVTIVRFDPVYVTHFKTNKKRIIDYPNLYGWLRDVYQSFGIKETVSISHVKNHYFRSHPFINPSGIIPVGPEIDLDSKPNRDALSSASK